MYFNNFKILILKLALNGAHYTTHKSVLRYEEGYMLRGVFAVYFGGLKEQHLRVCKYRLLEFMQTQQLHFYPTKTF